jgi:hypothetical protein
LRGRDSGVEKARHVQPIVSRDEAVTRKSTNSALFARRREISVWDCVVADAVAVEPVSAGNSLLSGKITGKIVEFDTPSDGRDRTLTIDG